ncbi:hypothetical protein ACP4OV_022783 [Aristida adscensionis]
MDDSNMFLQWAMNQNHHHTEASFPSLQDPNLKPCSLPLEDLRKITNNFSEDLVIGKGGFGKVYKGMVSNGDMVAVKKLTLTTPGIQDKQFENEVRHLMKLRHPNIVQLVGYCSETENILVPYNGKYVYAEKSERLLCLEYVPKGSLREHLSDESSGLDWKTRYKIIEGICYGLQYLHEQWKLNAPIIHMDLKPPNILLDVNMVPKIADFGLSRMFGEEQTRTCTMNRNGTLGYMAPEYISRGIITKKLDIFSLGVIIIEIITGHKDYPNESESSSQKFIDHVIKNWRKRMRKTRRHASWRTDSQKIRRCIKTGLACVKFDWEERPTICQVIKMLHGNERKRRSSGLRSSIPEVLVGDGQQGHHGEERLKAPPVLWFEDEEAILDSYIVNLSVNKWKLVVPPRCRRRGETVAEQPPGWEGEGDHPRYPLPMGKPITQIPDTNRNFVYNDMPIRVPPPPPPLGSPVDGIFIGSSGGVHGARRGAYGARGDESRVTPPLPPRPSHRRAGKSLSSRMGVVQP